jgi:hypothetical protein
MSASDQSGHPQFKLAGGKDRVRSLPTSGGLAEPLQLPTNHHEWPSCPALRGFLGIDSAVPPGYKSLSYIVHIKGNGTKEQFAEIHKAVMVTSPNFHNVSRPVDLRPTLVVE